MSDFATSSGSFLSPRIHRADGPRVLPPYFAAKAARDALAVSYSTELARWGIATTIMVLGAFTKGTNHFAHSGKPPDEARAAAYETGPYAGVTDQALKDLASLEPADADPAEVARQIVRVVDICTPVANQIGIPISIVV